MNTPSVSGSSGSTPASNPSAAPLLSFRSVTKSFGSGSTEVRALTDIDLDVQAGEFVAVMGPSGCGKSTLLHLAGALERPNAGRIEFAGRDLSDLGPVHVADLRRRDLGFVFQQLNLIPSLTALENVMLPLELDGTTGKAARSAAIECLHRVDVTQQLDRYPDDFSGGQQQRIAIARAIVGGRRMILADEPTGALDTINADMVVELLASIAETDGTTVVMVTHDPRFASMTDRVVFLRDGRIVDQTASSYAGVIK